MPGVALSGTTRGVGPLRGTWVMDGMVVPSGALLSGAGLNGVVLGGGGLNDVGLGGAG